MANRKPEKINELLEFAADVSNRRQCLICAKTFPVSSVTIVREHTVIICYLCIARMKKTIENALDEKGRELDMLQKQRMRQELQEREEAEADKDKKEEEEGRK